MGVTVGLNCKLYRNASTHNSPSWVEMTGVKDANLSLEVTKAEATARLSGYKMYAAALTAGPLEFNLLADTSLTEYDILKAALIAHTVMDFAMSNGAIATTGNEYWRGDYQLFTWKRNEPLEECATVDITADLAYSTNVPGFTTVT